MSWYKMPDEPDLTKCWVNFDKVESFIQRDNKITVSLSNVKIDYTYETAARALEVAEELGQFLVKSQATTSLKI